MHLVPLIALYEKQFPCLFIIHPREYIEGEGQSVVRLMTAALHKNKKREIKREIKRETEREREKRNSPIRKRSNRKIME